MVVGLVFLGGMTGFALTLGLYLQLGLGFTPLAAGLTQPPWALGVAVGSVLSVAWLSPRFGRTTIQGGAVVMGGLEAGFRVVLRGVAATVLATGALTVLLPRRARSDDSEPVLAAQAQL
jgi:hypothetical protein